MMLRPAAIITIVICTFLALKADTLKKVVIYSTASQIGYIFLLVTIWASRDLLFQLLLLDAINKIALFTIIAHIQNKTNDLKFENFKSIENSPMFKILVAFALIFSAGLPLTSMFLVKIKLFDLLLSNGLIIEFIVVIFGGALSILYHFKLVKAIFFSPATNGTIKIQTNLYGLTSIIIIQIATLIYAQDLAIFTGYTESLIGG
jgi:multicomponent Na+:H+ antiporter subunit D